MRREQQRGERLAQPDEGRREQRRGAALLELRGTHVARRLRDEQRAALASDESVEERRRDGQHASAVRACRVAAAAADAQRAAASPASQLRQLERRLVPRRPLRPRRKGQQARRRLPAARQRAVAGGRARHEDLEVRRELRHLHPICAAHRPHHVPSLRLRAPALHLATVLRIAVFRRRQIRCEAPAAACLRDCECRRAIRPPLQAENRCREPPRAAHLSMLQQVHDASTARRGYHATPRGHGDQRARTARHRAKGTRVLQHDRREADADARDNFDARGR
eukprot:scaffold96967_cov66-Phaeocystis_antarctica.AAC.2